MKKILLTLLTLFCSQITVMANQIHFDNEAYELKFSAIAPRTNGYGNEYFKPNENVTNWTKMVGVYYYPEENNPIKFAQNFDKTIEKTENSVLLKFIENKKTDKAVISFLVNNSENGKKYFEYDIYKFEKHPQKGMIMIKYAKKEFFKTNEEITKLAQKIKNDNDKYLEMLILSPTPNIIEKDIQITN